MASTNKTTHYSLSQYIGTDKPTYLVDYNQDMERIDLGIYGADSKATINTSSIGTLSNLTTSVKTDLVSSVNEVNSNIGDLTDLDTTAKADIVVSVNEVNTLSNLGLNTANTANSKADANTTSIATNTTAINNLEDEVEKLKRVTLWTNPAPTTSFNAQTVNLSDSLSNYDFYEILYEQTTLSTRTMTTGKIPVGSGTILHWVTTSTYFRPTTETVSGSTLTFEDAHEGATVNNITTIPVKIIGYKK